MTYVSNGCVELTGYTAQELVNNDTIAYASIIHQEDKSWIWEYFTEKLLSKSECNCEYRIVTKGGKVKWVREIANGVYGESGELIFIEGYVSDISEKREQRQNSNHRNVATDKEGYEKRLQALLDGIPDVLLRIGKNGDCLSYKNENEQLTMQVSAYGQRNVKNLFPADIAEAFLKHTCKAIEKGSISTYEYRLSNNDNEDRCYEARFVKCDETEVICIIRDITDTVKAKEEYRTAKEFYESILNNVNIDIAVFDQENKYLLVSKSAIRDDALREWIIGKNDYEYCLHKGKKSDIADSRTEMYNLVDELKKPIEWIEELTDEGGKKRYFVRTLKPLKGPGNEKYKVGYGVDITALKVIQNELLRREHLLSFSHKLAKVGYWVWYPSTKKHEWSDGVFDILEEDKRHISPSLLSFINYIHPDDQEYYRNTIQISKQNNSSYSIEYRVITKTGKLKYIKEQSSSKRPDSNANQYLFGMVQDITEMKISQDALARSEEHFRAIAESSPVHIIEVSADYKITYINAVSEARRDGVIGSSVFDFVSAEYEDKLRETVDLVITDGVIGNLQLQGMGLVTSDEWYDVSIGPVKSGSGAVRSVILLAQNVTDKKQNEQEREKLIKEINNRYNELMQFNYIVSHNLRSPIANILGMSYILNPSTPPDDIKKIFEYIMQSAESIDTLIKDLNDVLTARSPLNERREEFLLSDIINGVCINLRPQINHSKAKIKVDIAKDTDSIVSIKSYIQSIVHNLISNAIKYKSSTRQPAIYFKAWKDAEHTYIEVSDNGIGIDMEQYSGQIFGLYKRFTAQNEGKGLGLHMTKAQVESLGGSITVESELGKGCTFKIVLANKTSQH
jgi:PAS domain S-box-containing protein